MTTVNAGSRADTHDMYVVHRVFRRESALMPRLVRTVRPGDSVRARLVAGHFRDYALGLHHHHSAEDELLWPLLLARVDLEADLVLRMEEQHHRVADGLAVVEKLLPAWEAAPSAATGVPIAAALASHTEALHEHLGDEEQFVLPLVEEHITQAEWDRLGDRFATETPKDKLLFFLGALLEEATPEERAHMLGNLPVPAKLAWRFIGRRTYARRIRDLRDPLAA
jgi:hemerythrin-like domain-containing protein